MPCRYSKLELYGLPAFVGGLATATALRIAPTMVMEAVLLGFWVTSLARVLALNHALRLPAFPAAELIPEEARPRDAAAALAVRFPRRSCLHGRAAADPARGSEALAAALGASSALDESLLGLGERIV